VIISKTISGNESHTRRAVLFAVSKPEGARNKPRPTDMEKVASSKYIYLKLDRLRTSSVGEQPS